MEPGVTAAACIEKWVSPTARVTHVLQISEGRNWHEQRERFVKRYFLVGSRAHHAQEEQKEEDTTNHMYGDGENNKEEHEME